MMSRSIFFLNILEVTISYPVEQASKLISRGSSTKHWNRRVLLEFHLLHIEDDIVRGDELSALSFTEDQTSLDHLCDDGWSAAFEGSDGIIEHSLRVEPSIGEARQLLPDRSSIREWNLDDCIDPLGPQEGRLNTIQEVG